jgi:hypothetical protein
LSVVYIAAQSAVDKGVAVGPASRRKERKKPRMIRAGSVECGRLSLPLIERRAVTGVDIVPPAVTVLMKSPDLIL